MDAEFTHMQNQVLSNACHEKLHRLTPELKRDLYGFLHMSIVKQHPFFRQLPHDALLRICEIATPANFLAGEVICRRGHTASSMFFLVTGRLELVIHEDGHDDE